MEVSVVIPVRNRKGVVGRAIQSVFDQTASGIVELILVDDASDDGTSAILASYQAQSPFPVVVLRNAARQGGAAARNRGAAAARGEWLAFLDSDDQWLPAHLESMLAVLDATGADGAYGAFFVDDGRGRKRRTFGPVDASAHTMADHILQGAGDARTSTFIFRREAFLRIGFDERLAKHQDWDLAVAFAGQFRFALDPAPTVVLYTNVENRMSNRCDHAATARFLEKHESGLQPETKAVFYLEMALKTLRLEGKNRQYEEYLKKSDGYARIRPPLQVLKRLAVGLPLVNSARLFDLLRKYEPLRAAVRFVRRRYVALLIRTSPELAVSRLYRKRTGKKLRLHPPVSYGEKQLWLNLFMQSPLVVQCADKYRVREYVRDRGCGAVLNELYGVWKTAAGIDWDALPSSFVLKANNGSRRNIICLNKDTLDRKAAAAQLDRWLKQDYGLFLAETQYSKIEPRIICEKYLGEQDGTVPYDYRFYCLNGRTTVISVKRSTEPGEMYEFVDRNWTRMPLVPPKYNRGPGPARPDHLEQMLDCAERLAAPFPFVRVDLYDIGGNPVFGELTFTPAGGVDEYFSEEGLAYFGSILRLPVKVLQVIDNLRLGGAQRVVEQLAPALRETGGMEIDVMGLARDSLVSRYNPAALWKIRRRIRREGIRIVHSHLFPTQFWTALACAGLGAAKPRLVTTEHNSFNRRRKHPLLRPLDRWTYGRYDRIVCVSPLVRDNLIAWLAPREGDRSRFVVIGNGVDVEAFRTAVPYRPEELGLPGGPGIRLLCMTSRFAEAKDHKTLVAALAALPGNVHLLLAGDGPLKEACVSFAESLGLGARVHFLGFRNDVARILKTADIVVLSSHWEGLSLAAIEGMASGRPFLASDVEGLAPMVEGAGLLFPEGDAAALAGAVRRLLDDPALYEEISDKCLRRAEKYGITEMVEQHRELYRTLAEGGRG